MMDDDGPGDPPSFVLVYSDHKILLHMDESSYAALRSWSFNCGLAGFE